MTLPSFSRVLRTSSALSLIWLAVPSIPAGAGHWETSAPVVGGKTCSSGEECAIWQMETVYGPQPGPISCNVGFDSRHRLSLMNCNSHPNPYNPIYTLGGFSWPVCDAGETGSASGCSPRMQKDKNCPMVGDPIDLKSGVLLREETDHVIGPQNALTARRTYWSDQYYEGGDTGATTRFGGAWRSNFDVSAAHVGQPSDRPDVTLSLPSGEQLLFEFNYYANRYVLRTHNPVDDFNYQLWASPRTLRYEAGNWIFDDTDSTTYRFNDSGQAVTIRSLGL